MYFEQLLKYVLGLKSSFSEIGPKTSKKPDKKHFKSNKKLQKLSVVIVT